MRRGDRGVGMEGGRKGRKGVGVASDGDVVCNTHGDSSQHTSEFITGGVMSHLHSNLWCYYFLMNDN